MKTSRTRLWIPNINSFSGCTGEAFYFGHVRDGHVHVTLRRPSPNEPPYKKGERVRIINPRQVKTWKGKPRPFMATVLDDQKGSTVKILRDGNKRAVRYSTLYLERLIRDGVQPRKPGRLHLRRRAG